MTVTFPRSLNDRNKRPKGIKGHVMIIRTRVRTPSRSDVQLYNRLLSTPFSAISTIIVESYYSEGRRALRLLKRGDYKTRGKRLGRAILLDTFESDLHWTTKGIYPGIFGVAPPFCHVRIDALFRASTLPALARITRLHVRYRVSRASTSLCADIPHDTWTENRIWSVVTVTDNDRDENSRGMCRSIKPYTILYLLPRVEE
jgi:hypothetical protein